MLFDKDPQAVATAIAALTFYKQHGQGDPANRTDEIHDLATDDDSHISMDDQGIDGVIAELQAVQTASHNG